MRKKEFFGKKIQSLLITLNTLPAVTLIGYLAIVEQLCSVKIHVVAAQLPSFVTGYVIRVADGYLICYDPLYTAESKVAIIVHETVHILENDVQGPPRDPEATLAKVRLAHTVEELKGIVCRANDNQNREAQIERKAWAIVSTLALSSELG